MPDVFEYVLISDILIAFDGYVDQLKTIHGSGKKDEATESRIISTPEDFKAAFGKQGIK